MRTRLNLPVPCSKAMAEPGGPRRFSVRQVGGIAARGLVPGLVGRIRAVFERSFYVECGSSWACYGAAGIGSGPLNARLDAPDELDWRTAGLRVGNPVRILRDEVRVGSGYRFPFTSALHWQAPRPPNWTSASLGQGLAAFGAAAHEQAPADGLGVFALCLACPDPMTAVARAAAVPIRRLAGRLGDALTACGGKLPGDFRSCRGLIGLGPGLTPSGDDFLGGVMIALDLLGRLDLRQAVADEVLGFAAQETNAVSLAHLGAAAEGQGSAALHELLNHLLAGDRTGYPCHVDAIDAIGHTSGWDGLAGAVTVFRASLGGSALCAIDEGQWSGSPWRRGTVPGRSSASA